MADQSENHMNFFLKNLHQRTRAIPDTPAAKRLKVFLHCLTRSDEVVYQLTLTLTLKSLLAVTRQEGVKPQFFSNHPRSSTGDYTEQIHLIIRAEIEPRVT